MEEVEQGLFGERHVHWLARADLDFAVSPEEARVDVAIHEFPAKCPEPPWTSRGHAGDNRNSLRDRSVVRQRRLQADVRGPLEAGSHGQNIGTLPRMGLSERLEAAPQLAQAP